MTSSSLSIDGLTAPLLLLAMPQVRDPFFQRSVVLLVAHEEDGSLGFVLNRPTDLKVEQILEDLDIPWGGDPEMPAYLGGPVEPQVGSVLFPSAEVVAAVSEASALISNDVCLTRNLSILTDLAADPPRELRVVLGHAGWSPGQLAEEISRHDWLTAPVTSDLVFATPAAAWRLSLQSIGIDPDSLPEWTASEQEAN
jgi:putative transcriptional regulator